LVNCQLPGGGRQSDRRPAADHWQLLDAIMDGAALARVKRRATAKLTER
jgi:hypothetical protein